MDKVGVVPKMVLFIKLCKNQKLRLNLFKGMPKIPTNLKNQSNVLRNLNWVLLTLCNLNGTLCPILGIGPI